MKNFFLMLMLCFPLLAFAAESSEVANVKTVVVADGVKIEAKTEHEESVEQAFKIDVIYPQIMGENLSAQAVEFNQLVQRTAANEVEQFKKYIRADAIHMKTLPEDLQKNTLTMDYDVDVIKPDTSTLISVRLKIEGFQAGRAHPYHSFQTLTFDLTAGKAITLESLFKPKSNYLKVMSAYSVSTLKPKLEDHTMLDAGTKPLLKNFSNWNLVADGIVVTFPEYQVAPYVNGAQTVKIPYEVLKKVIAPGAVIYPCMVKPDSCQLKQE